jgi:hypothetical protein
MDYETTANELSNRILALIPEHPEILEIEDAFYLFYIEEFQCNDLQPSMAQAQWALRNAKNRYAVTS